MTNEDLAKLVERAREGDEEALSALVRELQDSVYRLCIRMLGDPADAQDACQEALIKVVTRLSGFRGEAGVRTWAHRIASNHVISHLRQASRRPAPSLSFEAFGDVIDGGVAAFDDAPVAPERVLAEEVRLTCTQGMLMCLDRDQRLAYVLGEILEFDAPSAGAVLEISPAAFRQRLARARKALLDFMQRRCGVYSKANPCRCDRQVPYARSTGMLDPQRLRFVRHRAPQPDDADLGELMDLLDVGATIRGGGAFVAPDDIADAIRAATTRKDN